MVVRPWTEIRAISALFLVPVLLTLHRRRTSRCFNSALLINIFVATVPRLLSHHNVRFSQLGNAGTPPAHIGKANDSFK